MWLRQVDGIGLVLLMIESTEPLREVTEGGKDFNSSLSVASIKDSGN